MADKTEDPGEREKREVKLTYIDRADCMEVFSDSINAAFFDGQSLRLEFGITRVEDVRPNAPARTARRMPAVRVAMTASGAIELMNRLQQIAAALREVGIIKANEQEQGEMKTN